jgi:excisionase family DNA binding protein
VTREEFEIVQPLVALWIADVARYVGAGWVTISEAAKLLRCSRQTIWRHIQAGDLKVHGPSRNLLRKDVMALKLNGYPGKRAGKHQPLNRFLQERP